jgi:hypothetical protein
VNATQPSLLDYRPPIVHPRDRRSIRAAFERFHRDNPHVLAELENLAQVWWNAGHRRCAIGMLWEKLRWETGITSTEHQPSLNNNFRAHYARLILERHPDWDRAGFIDTRGLRTL